MSSDLESFGGELVSSPELRDVTLLHIPEVAIEKQLSALVRYHLSTFRFIEILYYPDAPEPGARLMIDLVDAQTTFPVPDIDKTTMHKLQHYDPKYRGTLRRCWIDPDTGEIDTYTESTGELVHGTTFVEDKLFENPPPSGGILGLGLELDFPVTTEDWAIADLNESFEIFTQDKLDALLGAFAELDSKP